MAPNLVRKNMHIEMRMLANSSDILSACLQQSIKIYYYGNEPTILDFKKGIEKYIEEYAEDYIIQSVEVDDSHNVHINILDGDEINLYYTF